MFIHSHPQPIHQSHHILTTQEHGPPLVVQTIVDVRDIDSLKITKSIYNQGSRELVLLVPLVTPVPDKPDLVGQNEI